MNTRADQIEQARRLIETGISEDLKEALENKYPELIESEDERIKRELVEFLDEVWHLGKNTNFDRWGKADCADWIAYLEKQKEQNTLSTEETELNSIAFLEQLGYTCVPPGAEQKPEVKYVYPKFRVGEEIVEATPNGYYPPVVVKYIGEGAYSCESKDGKRFLSFPIKNENKYRLVEQKPAEWSEEDKRAIDRACVALRDYSNGDLPEFLPSELLGYADRLQSLCPQPHWKPSEEQMGWLESAVKLSIDKPNIHGIIVSLYEQLKRL